MRINIETTCPEGSIFRHAFDTTNPEPIHPGLFQELVGRTITRVSFVDTTTQGWKAAVWNNKTLLGYNAWVAEQLK